MALTVKNIVVESPYIMSELTKLAVAPIYSGADASPIYITLYAEVSTSGTYTDGDIDYVFSGGQDSGTLDRLSIEDSPYFIDTTSNYNLIDKAGGVTQWDIGVIGTFEEEGKFTAVMGGLLTKGGGMPPFSPPIFYTASNFLLAAEGLRIDNSEDPPIESPFGVTLQVLIFFRGAIEDGDLKLVCQLSGGIDIDLPYTFELEDITDCSTWGSSEFRDIRGTYGGTDTDENGISYTWSVTIG